MGTIGRRGRPAMSRTPETAPATIERYTEADIARLESEDLTDLAVIAKLREAYRQNDPNEEGFFPGSAVTRDHSLIGTEESFRALYRRGRNGPSAEPDRLHGAHQTPLRDGGARDDAQARGAAGPTPRAVRQQMAHAEREGVGHTQGRARRAPLSARRQNTGPHKVTRTGNRPKKRCSPDEGATGHCPPRPKGTTSTQTGRQRRCGATQQRTRKNGNSARAVPGGQVANGGAQRTCTRTERTRVELRLRGQR